MINLRYHIVSIVAVFLALGVGIAVGATAGSRAEVAVLRERIDGLERSQSSLEKQRNEQKAELEVWNQFATESQEELLAGRLRDVPVLTVAVEGVEGQGVDDLRHQLAVAQARSQGTLWLTRKLRVDSASDAQALATAIGASVTDPPDALRDRAVRAIAAGLAGTGPPGVLAALRDSGFIELDPPEARPATASTSTTVPYDLNAPPTPGTRFVVVGGAGGEVADVDVAIPFTEVLGAAVPGVLAVESGQEVAGGREVFVGSLREDSALSQRVSTVDNLDSFIGQAASVLVLAQPPTTKPGHYGVGRHAQRRLPFPLGA